MAYDTKELKDRCIKEATDERKNLHFLEDVCLEVGISKPAFYDHFPSDSDDYKEIMGCLRANRVRTKKAMRKKWYDSDHPTLQVALMKLIGHDRDRKKLTQTHQDLTSGGGKIISVAITDYGNTDQSTTETKGSDKSE